MRDSIQRAVVSIDTALAARRRPELLAPAGDEEAMRAAVANGADAVYFGLQSFNARLRAENFCLDDLPRIMAYLHENGVKGYVTLNTLVFCDELAQAAKTLLACSDAGVDAVLIQDLGLALLARQLVPALPIHASTQMTLTAAESILGAQALGFTPDRVVAARELSRSELRKFADATDREIEVFVHGALCVAYSGQCLTSEALGGRSANRGECAQACRLPYDLIVDGCERDLGELRYLLSPKDLAAYEDIGDLVALGIAGLKIEGRLKSPLYVAAAVQAYRKALDHVATAPATRPRMDTATARMLAQTFSRGFTGGYLHEINHQQVVEGRYPKKRGLEVGRVVASNSRGVVVDVTGPVKLGDGIVFDSGRPDLDEEGGRIFGLWREKRPLVSFDPLETGEACARLTFAFGRGQLDHKRVKPGDRVWKTSDPALEAALRDSYAKQEARWKRPIRACLRGRVGAPLELVLRDHEGLTVAVTDDTPLQVAVRRPLTRETAWTQLARLGATPFELAALDYQVDSGAMVPLSRLNALRRRACEALLAHRCAIHRGRPRHPMALEEMRAQIQHVGLGEVPATPSLSVLCRTLEQVQAAVETRRIFAVYTDFEDIRLHRQARDLVPGDGPLFVPATLRVVKPGEAPLVRKLLEAAPDAVLVRNLAAMHILRDMRPHLAQIGDYPLNIANDLAATALMRRGLRYLTPSYDLNIDQLLTLLRATPPSWYEVVIHQYMPMFHMEHCIFCRFLSSGTDASNCGRPCEMHSVALRDRRGYTHPVKADAGCRNTVFNAVAQSASEYLPVLLRAGVRRFRLEFLAENESAVQNAITSYHAVLSGETDGRQLWKRLNADSKLGVTRGPLDHE